MHFAALLILGCSSDSDDNKQTAPNNLYGTWGGDNRTSTGNTRTLIVSFYSNMSGDLTYESNSYYRMAYFTYTVDGNIINCNGVMAGEDGNANENWSQSFEYHETYIKPIGAYADISLYKEGYDSYDDDNKSSNDKKYESMLVNTTWYSTKYNNSSVSFYSGHTLSFTIITSKGERRTCSGEWNVSDGQLCMSINSSDISMITSVIVVFPLYSATIVKLTGSELQLIDSSGKVHIYTK